MESKRNCYTVVSNHYTFEADMWKSIVKRIISRPEPNRLPEPPLPLYVRSVGYHEAEAGWSEFFPASDKNFVQIFWSVRGCGEFRIGDAVRLMPAESFLYHLPGEEHFHTAASDWAYHWFTLDGPLAAEFIRGYGYPREAMSAGACPDGLFLQLENLLREMTPYSQRKMLSVAADILALAGNPAGRRKNGAATRVVDRFLELVRAEYSDPGLDVNTLADRLGVHRTTLTRLFKERMLVSPGEYLLNLRIQTALSLLRGTDYPVSAVGEMVGIPHRGHFSTLIRRTVGVSPVIYRGRSSMM